jgi:DNA polymerase III alpha subunit
MNAARYAELQCASHFSFLRDASSYDELFAEAARLGIEALAITDRTTAIAPLASSAPRRPPRPQACA